MVLQEPNEEDLLEVKYLVRKPTKTKSAMFVVPEKDDIDEIDFMDIILKKRTVQQFLFNLDLSQYF